MEDGVLVDDGGPFWDIGATYMAATWFYRHDRPRLERTLELLAAHGLGYIRVLGEVGSSFWNRRETDPRWPDYDATVAGLTDLAHDRFGLRVQWTVFGGTDYSRTPAAREALVDRFAAMTRERPHKVLFLEIANEGWKNGFEGGGGLAELHHLTARLRRALRGAGVRTPVAPTAPEGTRCEDWSSMYAGVDADLATLHFPRAMSGPHGEWGPVVAPWTFRSCEGLPRVRANNEPVGPESSSVSEIDPVRLVAAAAVTVISQMPLHVFHSRAGVRGDVPFEDLPNVRETLAGFRALRELLPRTIASGGAADLREPGHAVQLTSPASGSGTGGAVAALGAAAGSDTWAIVVGLRDVVRFRANRAVTVRTLDLLTGKTLGETRCDEGQAFHVAGAGAVLLRISESLERPSSSGPR